MRHKWDWLCKELLQSYSWNWVWRLVNILEMLTVQTNKNWFIACFFFSVKEKNEILKINMHADLQMSLKKKGMWIKVLPKIVWC